MCDFVQEKLRSLREDTEVIQPQTIWHLSWTSRHDLFQQGSSELRED